MCIYLSYNVVFLLTEGETLGCRCCLQYLPLSPLPTRLVTKTSDLTLCWSFNGADEAQPVTVGSWALCFGEITLGLQFRKECLSISLLFRSLRFPFPHSFQNLGLHSLPTPFVICLWPLTSAMWYIIHYCYYYKILSCSVFLGATKQQRSAKAKTDPLKCIMIQTSGLDFSFFSCWKKQMFQQLLYCFLSFLCFLGIIMGGFIKIIEFQELANWKVWLQCFFWCFTLFVLFCLFKLSATFSPTMCLAEHKHTALWPVLPPLNPSWKKSPPPSSDVT